MPRTVAGTRKSLQVLLPSTQDSVEPSGVVINTGDTWQTVVNANPAGTQFIIATGTHTGKTVKLTQGTHDGDKFWFRAGAIMDGNAIQDQFAIWGDADNIEIRGVSSVILGRVTNYDNPMNVRGGSPPIGQSCAIWPYSTQNTFASRGFNWQIKYMEIDHNTSGGVQLDQWGVLAYCHVHHNGENNVGCAGSGWSIFGCEIDNGNYNQTFNPGFGAGGSKFANSQNCIVGVSNIRPFLGKDGQFYSNSFHDNFGPGLWFDINNQNWIAEYNLCYNNGLGMTQWDGNPNGLASAPGIFIEISYDGRARYNYCYNNNTHGTSNSGLSGQIVLSSSQGINSITNIDVSYNVVEVPASNGEGIVQVNLDRESNGDWNSVGLPAQALGLPVYQCLYTSIHHNTITHLADSGHNGAYIFHRSVEYYAGSNTWDYNTYNFTGAGQARFGTMVSGAPGSGFRTFAQIQAGGAELHGSGS